MAKKKKQLLFLGNIYKKNVKQNCSCKCETQTKNKNIIKMLIKIK